MAKRKKYVLVFNKWSIYSTHSDITEYDTLKEANEEIKLLEEIYADTPRPKVKSRYNGSSGYFHKYKRCVSLYDYAWGDMYLGEAFWGYLLLDREAEKIVKWGNDYLKAYAPSTDVRRVKDEFLRGEDEIPEKYKWDDGEYLGWLQYRWGNGLNSVEYGEDAVIEDIHHKKTCVKHCKYKKKKYTTKPYNEEEEAALDKMNEELLETIDVTKEICN